MKYEFYLDQRATDDFSIVDFTSVGKKGALPKRVLFTPTEIEKVYNLAFGDIMENGEIDDQLISDNGDRNKVLATIFDIVKNYTSKYPERWLSFKGSSMGRNRLYRIAIGTNLNELSNIFEIYNYDGKIITEFSPDMDVNIFLIKRKIF